MMTLTLNLWLAARITATVRTVAPSLAGSEKR